MTKEDIKFIRGIAKLYGVRLVIKKIARRDVCGCYCNQTNTIILDRYNATINSFFHELGHHYCVIRGIWKNYHIGSFITIKKNGDLYFMRNKFKKMLRVAHRAELWIDSWGKKEAEFWFPDTKYEMSYFKTKESKMWIRDYFTEMARKYICRF